VASDAASVPHLLARGASVDGEETLLEMLHGCVLERGMADEGDAVEVEGRVNASTRIAMWLIGAIVNKGLDAASVDVLCMVLDLDCDKAASTNQLQHWQKGLLATAHHHHHLLLQLLLKVFIFMRRNPGAAENGAEDVLGFLNSAMKDLATHACPHACP